MRLLMLITQKMKWSTEDSSAFLIFFFSPPLSLMPLGRVLNSVLFLEFSNCLSYMLQSPHPHFTESGYHSAVMLMYPQLPSYSIPKLRGSWNLKVASVTAANTKEVLLKEECGEDPGNRAEMFLWDQMVLLQADYMLHCHLWWCAHLALHSNSGAWSVSLLFLLCMFTRIAT